MIDVVAGETLFINVVFITSKFPPWRVTGGVNVSDKSCGHRVRYTRLIYVPNSLNGARAPGKRADEWPPPLISGFDTRTITANTFRLAATKRTRLTYLYIYIYTPVLRTHRARPVSPRCRTTAHVYYTLRLRSRCYLYMCVRCAVNVSVVLYARQGKKNTLSIILRR